MTSTQAGRSTAARIVPALALVAIAGACALFVLSTKPVDDPSGTAAGQAASLALPAIFTAGLAAIAALLLFLAGDLSKRPLHPADLGSDVANEELEASVATRRSAELAEIDAALIRLASTPEAFGRDEQTGADIPFARLDLIPYARTNVTG